MTHGSEKYLFFNIIKNRIPFKKIYNNFTKEILIDETVMEKSLIEQKMSEILTLYESIHPTKKQKTGPESEKAEKTISEELSAIFENINEEEMEAEIKNSYLLSVTQLADTTGTETDTNSSKMKFEPYPEVRTTIRVFNMFSPFIF